MMPKLTETERATDLAPLLASERAMPKSLI